MLAHLKENPALGAPPGAAKPAEGAGREGPAAASVVPGGRAALGQLGRNLRAFAGLGRPPTTTAGCRGAAAAVGDAPATSVIDDGDGSDDGDIETYHADPAALLPGDAALLAQIDAAESILGPGSAATDAERMKAEEALWTNCDLPFIDAEAIGRAHALGRVCSFLDTYAGGAPQVQSLHPAEG